MFGEKGARVRFIAHIRSPIPLRVVTELSVDNNTGTIHANISFDVVARRKHNVRNTSEVKLNDRRREDTHIDIIRRTYIGGRTAELKRGRQNRISSGSIVRT